MSDPSHIQFYPNALQRAAIRAYFLDNEILMPDRNGFAKRCLMERLEAGGYFDRAKQKQIEERDRASRQENYCP